MGLADEMGEVLRRWESSGLSLRAFGKREEISYSKLIYWKRRFRDGGGGGKEAKRTRPDEDSAWAAVRVIADERSEDPKVIEVWLANGVSLGIPEGTDEGELRRLLGVLSSC